MKHSAVNLVGLGVGAISTFLVYPHVLEAYGLAQVLLSVSLIGLPILSLGANTVAIRFFPRFQNKSTGHNGFLPLLIALCAMGCLFFGLLAWVFWDPFSTVLEGKSPLLREYLWMAFPLAFCYITSTVLAAYSSNFKRIVVPSLLLDFSQKLALPLLLIAVWQEWLPLQTAMFGLLIHAALVTVGLVLYLRHIGEWFWRPNWAFVTPALRREMLQFIGFGAFGGFALLVAAKSDVFMVGSLSAVKAAGVYAIAAYVATVIEIPTKSLYAASASSVAKYLADNDRPALEKLYKSVSINLLVAGMLLFGCIWISIDSLFNLLPNGEELAAGKWVLLFIGLSRLVEMGTGLNNYMVYYSQYYRYSLLSLGLLAVVNIMLSIWLIPILGITGAAMATLLSITSYNTLSLGLVWLKFRLFPFTRDTMKAIGLALLAFLVANLIPFSGYDLLDLFLHSGFFALIFSVLVLKFRVSEDLNGLESMIKAKLRKRN
ncbi:MAG: polysaccharide biosynthesis C-terminal domain-containing protein [Saprospiraceae bacterium]|nr:polysaccharide biosynthesis C-terminal domain-containing protein [Saprospiraceae bacterium]